jgi:tRNA-dihydrouridine synthase B
MATLTESWTLGGLRIPNRVLLAPLAGIGNWFVRAQARRYGAGMAVSEMVSGHAIHHRNRRTLEELLRIHPDERDPAGRWGAVPGVGTQRGPVSIQLFGQDPEVIRSAAAAVASAGADLIDLNMGCPVPKVCRTGAGAALLEDPDRAVAIARAARAGGGLPVTVKLRSGARPGDRSGIALARRLVAEAGVAAIAIHPRAAAARHSGAPDYELVRELAETLDAPVILTGGLRDAPHIRAVFAQTGVAAVMLARGSLGNPWLFRELVGEEADGEEAESGAPPAPREVAAELCWVMDRAAEHLGARRAGRYLRKFYPWYVARLGLRKANAARVQAILQSAEELPRAREIFAAAAHEAAEPGPAAAAAAA